MKHLSVQPGRPVQDPWECKGEKAVVAFPLVPSEFPLNDISAVTIKVLGAAGSLRRGLGWSLQWTCSHSQQHHISIRT